MSKPCYAECGEDLFVLRCFMDHPKESRSFLDIGADHPLSCSHTALLEKSGWTGIALSTSPKHPEWDTLRPNTRYIQVLDYKTIVWSDLECTTRFYHYANFDIPHSDLLAFLAAFPFDTTRFFVCTVTHHAYALPATKMIRKRYLIECRGLLKAANYRIASSNVRYGRLAVADWYLHRNFMDTT